MGQGTSRRWWPQPEHSFFMCRRRRSIRSALVRMPEKESGKSGMPRAAPCPLNIDACPAIIWRMDGITFIGISGVRYGGKPRLDDDQLAKIRCRVGSVIDRVWVPHFSPMMMTSCGSWAPPPMFLQLLQNPIEEDTEVKMLLMVG